MVVKLPTVRDVAKRAGVSLTTVSFVLNNVPYARISEEARARVWNAARELDYQPNAAAQSLRRRSTHTIGLLIPDNNNPHFWQIVRGAERAAAEKGYSVLLTSSNLEIEQERRAFEALKQQRMDGLILQTAFPSALLRAIEALKTRGHPVVRIGRFSPDLDGVAPDYGIGCTMLMEHLVQLGHRRVGFVFATSAPGGPRPEVGLGQSRLGAYRDAVQRHDLDADPDLVQGSGPHPEDACGAARRLLELSPRPTAIMVINDYLAISVLKMIADAGLSVPRDISLTGFDDIPLARYLSPALTTVSANAERLGERAVELMLARLEEPEAPPQHHVLPTYLVVRDSTKEVSAP